MTIGFIRTGTSENDFEASLRKAQPAINSTTGSAVPLREPAPAPPERDRRPRGEFALLAEVASLRAQLRQELNLRSKDYRLLIQLQQADLKSCRELRCAVERRLERDANYLVLKQLDSAYCQAIKLSSGRAD